MTTNRTPCGIAIPQDFINKPVDIQLIRQFLHRAEMLSYDSLWVQEQMIGDAPLLEPVGLLTYASALTSRLRLGTSMLTTVVYNPIQLAKSLASLDQLSQGRLTVGVSLGGLKPASMFGYSERRVRRFVEGLLVMKALWTETRATFTGTFWQFHDVALEPKPVQQPHPPVWFGARQSPGLKRAVRYGDGWMSPSSSLADFTKRLDLLHRFLDEAQRDPATFSISKRVYLAIDDDRRRAERRLREWFGVRYKDPDEASRVSIWGSRAECTEKLMAFIRAGAQHLLFNPVFDEMEHLDLLAQEVMPHL